MPDFPNFDIAYPQPHWEEAIDWYLTQVRKERPDFVLVAGDLVDGHYWDSREQLEHLTAVYFGNWIRRMQRYGLTYYVAVGDHDIGDDPWPPEKVKLVPLFERAFSEHFGMPANGPAGSSGRVYYVLHKNLLLVTVETFEVRDNQVHMTVSGEQLKWLEDVLEQHRHVAHIVVQGHVPVIPGAKGRSTSSLVLEGGTESGFWRLMTKYGVELYLCGEFHDVTVTRQDGILHVVHGASWGRVDTINYLVGTVWPDRIEIAIKVFPVTLGGGNIWNINKPEGPRETVAIPDEATKTGPKVIQTMTIARPHR
jgi:3',5'-cyclic AMP phosphodiesterase CpdA